MEKQPAKINYFFGKCYRDLWNTIKTTFSNLGDSIRNCAEHIGDVWDDEGYATPLGIIQIGFFIGLLICSAIISTVFCVVFSIIHVVFTVLIMTFIYLWFTFLFLLDSFMRHMHKIVSSCPNDQRKFALPHYRCPKCGTIHTKLRPSKYGILKRECQCGARLPTTFFNGRQKLEAICPYCGYSLTNGGFHVNISVPVIGGPSSGKTCFINQAIGELERIAEPELGYEYEYIAGSDSLPENLQLLSRGQLPQKTSEMRLVYYEFYFTPKKKKVKNQISLCDVGGEVYMDSSLLSEQIGYSLANGYLMVIDPLSIATYRKEVEKQISTSGYTGSATPIDEVLSVLIKTIENMRNYDARKKVEENLAIVFSKCDIPGLEEKIGETAVSEYLANSTEKKLTRMQARNKICEQFLIDYDEADFVNAIRSKFTTVQFFTSSALGHNVDGTAFNPSGVADPILWIIDKKSPTIDFKKRWAQK